MSFLAVVAWVIYVAAQTAIFVLWARILLDFVTQFRRDWRPTGVLLIASIWVLRLTDPPLRAVRKVVKPVRFGAAQVDLAMLVLLLALIILTNLAAQYRAA